MEYSREITKRLYDKHGFIADNFHDPQMCKLYNDLTVNNEEYESLFWHFGCRLKFEHKCYFLEREIPTRQEIKRGIEDYYRWLDIIDFLYDVFGSIGPGFIFRFSELHRRVETNVNLTNKVKALPLDLAKGEVPETKMMIDKLLEFLREKQVFDQFEEPTELVTVYQFTSVYQYYKEYVKGLTLRKQEEEKA